MIINSLRKSSRFHNCYTTVLLHAMCNTVLGVHSSKKNILNVKLYSSELTYQSIFSPSLSLFHGYFNCIAEYNS